MGVDSVDSQWSVSTVDQWKSSVWSTSTEKSSVASMSTVDGQHLYNKKDVFLNSEILIYNNGK